MKALRKRYGRGYVTDDAASIELELYAENTVELYPQKQAILANLRKKIAKGTFDQGKAAKLWGYWVESAAKRYAKEFSTGKDWHVIFPKSAMGSAINWPKRTALGMNDC